MKTTSTDSPASTPLAAPQRDPDSDTVLPRHTPASAQRQPVMRDTSSVSIDAGRASGGDRYRPSGDEPVPRASPQRTSRSGEILQNGYLHATDSRATGSILSSPKPVTARAVEGAAATVPSAPSSAGPSGAPPAPPFLSGVTRDELLTLLDTHDKETLPDGTRVRRNTNQDDENAARLGEDLTRGLTGYAPEVQQFERQLSDMQARLGTLPPAEHEAYAGALATLDVAYRNGDADGRRQADAQRSLLDDALFERASAALNDPVERALGVFNPPLGAGYLTQPGDQQRLAALTWMREGFTASTTPVARQHYFSQAAELKNDLQHKVAVAIDQHTTQEAGKWAEANTEVDRILHEAEAVADDPGKRYEVIGRQLFSSNPGSGSDDLADRRLLAFTQRMQDDSALRDKLAGWSVDAGRKLNEYGVDAQKNYQDILKNLPPAGPDYVRDLSDQYNAVLHDTSYKDDSITPRARAEKLANQVLEGTARFLLGLTPLAPVTAALDPHSSLSENARLGIDVTSALLGLAAGEGASAFAERLGAKSAAAIARGASEEHLPERPPTGDDRTAPAAPSVPAGEAGNPARPRSARATDITTQGLPVDTRVAEASQRINGKPPALPDDYATPRAPATLKPAADQKGMLTDNNGQHYIARDGKTYPVRFDRDNGTWRVYRSDNPYRPQYPVRLDADGNWQVHNDVGLKGGMDPQDPPVRNRAARFDEDFQVSTSSGAAPSAQMRQTLDPATWRSAADRWPDDPAYTARYQRAFDSLPREQRHAIRSWSYLDTSDTYSTDSAGSGSSDYNYDLNHQLYRRAHGQYTGERARDLQAALNGLPKPDGENQLLRIADVPIDYASHFAPGDYVTNSPAFMATSSDGGHAGFTLSSEEWETGSHRAFALYDIKATSATPLVKYIDTMSEGEREWLFVPNTVFRVDEIATATPREPGERMSRIGVHLTEVPITAPTYAKNIYSGKQELVYPQGTPPVYTPLQPGGQAPVAAPPHDPNQPPPPTHGDPNQPGPSNA